MRATKMTRMLCVLMLAALLLAVPSSLPVPGHAQSGAYIEVGPFDRAGWHWARSEWESRIDPSSFAVMTHASIAIDGTRYDDLTFTNHPDPASIGHWRLGQLDELYAVTYGAEVWPCLVYNVKASYANLLGSPYPVRFNSNNIGQLCVLKGNRVECLDLNSHLNTSSTSLTGGDSPLGMGVPANPSYRSGDELVPAWRVAAPAIATQTGDRRFIIIPCNTEDVGDLTVLSVCDDQFKVMMGFGACGFWENGGYKFWNSPVAVRASGTANTMGKFYPNPLGIDFSYAGIVLDKDGDIIMGESFGATDENRNVWAQVGTFTASDLTYAVSDFSLAPPSGPDSRLRWFAGNNRSFAFSLGSDETISTTRRGSDVVLFVQEGSTSEVLTVNIPSITLHNYSNSPKTYTVVVAVASSQAKKYTIALTMDRTVEGNTTTSLDLPPLRISSPQPGDRYTVRVVVYTDRGPGEFGARWNPIEYRICPGTDYTETARVIHEWHVTNMAGNDRSWVVRHQVRDLGALWPSVAAALGDAINVENHSVASFQVQYVRYVGDTAQASVTLLPITATYSWDGEIELSARPNFPQVIPSYVPNGGSVSVPTDVPLRLGLRFSTVSSPVFTVTVPGGDTITGTVNVSEHLVCGQVRWQGIEGEWRFGPKSIGGRPGTPGCPEYPYVPGKEELPLMNDRYTDEGRCVRAPKRLACECVEHNVSECLRMTSDIDGILWFGARGSAVFATGGITYTVPVKIWDPAPR
ncbi:hypothetical protein, partial [Thermogutta sp.]|uniref:hypothetical protein n=1 Tax=Thermogutta sp. TaxID=1962930 RepID=UPI00321FF506